MKVKFVKFDKNARIPKKAHPSDMGFDVYAVSEREVAPNVWQYGLGFGLQIERGDEELGDIRDGYEGMWGISPQDCVKIDKALIDMETCPLSLSIDFRPRSSVWKTGMVLANSCGTVDENYVGEIKLCFYHVMTSMERYHVGDKIAQCKLGMAFPMDFVEVDKLDETDRGDGSFGSSGK